MKKESVWDYPRPPRLEDVNLHLKVILNKIVLVSTNKAIRILETSHPPVYYFPLEDVTIRYLKPNRYTTNCEFKGLANYYDLYIDGKVIENVAWYYVNPKIPYTNLKNRIAFYPSKMDECWVGDELAKAQEGDFYGGWITKNIEGPFKGGPGTWGW